MILKIGDKVKVVGMEGGCTGNKCYKCYKGKTLIVENIPKYPAKKGERTIRAQAEKDGSHCIFIEEDLQLLKVTNWKEVIE